MHTNSFQSTEEIHEPVSTTKVPISNRLEPILFLFLDQVYDILVFNSAQFIFTNLSILTFLPSGQ